MITIDEANFYNGDEKWIKEIGIDNIEESRLNNWAKINDKYYYVKSNYGKYHEIIGEIIAKSLKLDTAHYEICKMNDKYFYLSPNFKDKNKIYKRVYELFNGKNIIDQIDDLELVKQILKMTALDIFMMQVDRTAFNYLFEIDEKIKLAPLYDYSCCYFANSNTYELYMNGLFKLPMKSKELREFKEKYPELENYLDIIYDTDYLKLLKNNLKIYDHNLESSNEKYYSEKFNEGRKLINKIYRA